MTTANDIANAVWTSTERTVDGLAPAASNGTWLDNVCYAVWTYGLRSLGPLTRLGLSGYPVSARVGWWSKSFAGAEDLRRSALGILPMPNTITPADRRHAIRIYRFTDTEGGSNYEVYAIQTITTDAFGTNNISANELVLVTVNVADGSINVANLPSQVNINLGLSTDLTNYLNAVGAILQNIAADGSAAGHISVLVSALQNIAAEAAAAAVADLPAQVSININTSSEAADYIDALVSALQNITTTDSAANSGTFSAAIVEQLNIAYNIVGNGDFLAQAVQSLSAGEMIFPDSGTVGFITEALELLGTFSAAASLGSTISVGIALDPSAESSADKPVSATDNMSVNSTDGVVLHAVGTVIVATDLSTQESNVLSAVAEAQQNLATTDVVASAANVLVYATSIANFNLTDLPHANAELLATTSVAVSVADAAEKAVAIAVNALAGVGIDATTFDRLELLAAAQVALTAATEVADSLDAVGYVDILVGFNQSTGMDEVIALSDSIDFVDTVDGKRKPTIIPRITFAVRQDGKVTPRKDNTIVVRRNIQGS